MSLTLCQRCGGGKDGWNVHQAEFSVKGIDHWKVQLCNECSDAVEQAVLAALRPPAKESRR